jgi:hypothetical protein
LCYLSLQESTQRDFNRVGKTLFAAHVWHYNHTSHIASTHTDVLGVCVGYDNCNFDENEGRVLRVNGGLQLGNGPIFRTEKGGQHMVGTDSSGRQIFRVDLTSGGTVVGSGLTPPKSGVQVNGYASTSADTERWLATSGFQLFGEDGLAKAQIHNIVHKEDAGITGVRVAPLGGVRADHAIHITPQAIVTGDAPAEFVRSNGKYSL